MSSVLRAALLAALLIPGGAVFDGAAAGHRMESLDAEIRQLVDRMSESIVSIAAVSKTAGDSAAGTLVSRSVGTGVVYDEGGLILTTASVVGYADEVEVRTTDGLEYTGEVIGTDPGTDLAVVRVEGLAARPARLSDEKALSPGSLVFVIGNSYGQLPSVSMGVISSPPAPLGEDGGEEMLRMSVPVSPGNTGAPIVGARGEVIGLLVGRLSAQPVSYAMRTHEGGVRGFAQFIEPSNTSVGLPAYRLRDMAREIIEHGGKRPGFLGVRVAAAPGGEGGPLGLGGVVVTSVVAGSPAESIGLEAGDIIWRFGAENVTTPAALKEMVSSSPPGSEVTVWFTRGDEHFDRKVRVARRSPEAGGQAAFVHWPEDIDLRIRMMRREIDRMEKEIERLEAAR